MTQIQESESFTMNEPSTPPPTIGKMGPYTVFITPSESPNKYNIASTPIQSPPVKSAVHPPPVHYRNSTSLAVGVFWDAVAKVQNAHSSLDERVAHWFGLNQSKYQWALDDYYESKGVDKVAAPAKHASTKAQSV